MNDHRWVSIDVVYAIHEEQLAEHGGSGGLLDCRLLDSALARPKNAVTYSEVDLYDLAARYAYGITQNHPFVDGNKRTALVVCELFLELNGRHLTASNEACVLTFLALAAGELSEDALTSWLRINTTEPPPA